MAQQTSAEQAVAQAMLLSRYYYWRQRRLKSAEEGLQSPVRPEPAKGLQ